MTTSLLLFLTIGLSLIVMGIILRRDGKKSNDAKIHGYGLIALFLGIFLLIIGSAHSFLHKAAWTDDNKQLFFFILIGTSLLFAVLFGVSFLLHSLKSGSKIGLISASLWAISSIAVSVIGFSKVSTMNDGWTKEKEKAFIDRCKSEDKYDCDCKFQIVKSTYPDPEDYNVLIEDEVKNSAAIGTLNGLFANQCLKCDTLKTKRETQKVGEGEGGLPADF